MILCRSRALGTTGLRRRKAKLRDWLSERHRHYAEVPVMKAAANIIRPPREIVSYNNDDAQNALRPSLALSLIREFEIIRRIPNADRWNPLSIANTILSRCPSSPLPLFPFAPFLSLCGADQIFSFTRSGIDLTREKQNLRVSVWISSVPRASGNFRVPIYSRRLFNPFQEPHTSILQVFMSRVLHKALCNKSIILHTFRASLEENSIMDDYLLIADLSSACL